MGIDPFTVAIASLAVSAVAGFQQHRAAQQAAEAQEEAADIGSARAQVQRRQQRRQQIREERIRRARILQSAETSGVAGSSGAIGAAGALGTITGANISNIASQASAERGLSRASQNLADANQQSQIWGSIGSVSSGVFSASASQVDFGAPSGGQGQPVQGGFTSEVFTF